MVFLKLYFCPPKINGHYFLFIFCYLIQIMQKAICSLKMVDNKRRNLGLWMCLWSWATYRIWMTCLPPDIDGKQKYISTLFVLCMWMSLFQLVKTTCSVLLILESENLPVDRILISSSSPQIPRHNLCGSDSIFSLFTWDFLTSSLKITSCEKPFTTHSRQPVSQFPEFFED